MVLILVFIAAIGAGVIGFRAATDTHTQPPPKAATVEPQSPAPPAPLPPAGQPG